MQPPPDPDSAREDDLDSVIAEYLQAVESGQTPDREAFLARHADLADELAEFLDDREYFGQLAARFVGAPAAFEDTKPHGGIPSTGEPESATTHAGSMPRRVGDYELLEEIARGGMGVVYRAEQLSLRRSVAVKMILAGRRINDNMALYVTAQIVKRMVKKGIAAPEARVLMLGLAFKENCPDVRNTKVVDVVSELQSYDMRVDIHDPWVDAAAAKAEYGVELVSEPEQGAYDVIVIAVAHDEFRALGEAGMRAFGNENSILYDIKYVLPADQVDGRL